MDTTEETKAPEVSLPIEGSPTAARDQQLAPESSEAQILDQTTTDDAPENGNENGSDAAAPITAGTEDASGNTPGTPLSKNAQKKLKRQKKWEDMRDDRKRRRKEKRIVKQEKKRAAKSEASEQAESAIVPAAPKEHVLVPVSLIFDCDFESYMRETELISLASQITRSYAANRTATRCAHIYVSSWGGKLQTRYETLLSNQHKRWNNVKFLAEDFVATAKQADTDMRGSEGGTIIDILEEKDGDAVVGEGAEGEEGGEAKTESEGPNVVYLTSDSPNTLTRLEPYTSYVIGGIVDKNREKGLCYGRAQERGIPTAKLPIGDYMVMASRQVLTTNHVVEIMLNWLETGDWATAFTNVIPKRKGGHLKGEKARKDGEAEWEKEGEVSGEEEAVGEDQDEKEETVANDGSMDLQDDVNASQLQAKTTGLTVLAASPAATFYNKVIFTPPITYTSPRVLYPRTVQLGDGTLLATWENYSPEPPVVYFPIYQSTDNGSSWTEISRVTDQTPKGWGLRYQPFLFELPADVGNFKAGTVLCAGNSIPTDLSHTQIDVYASTDRGRTWTFVSHVAAGGKAHPDNGQTPVWEPFILYYKGQIILYYSDQRDPKHGQKLTHQTSSDLLSWDAAVDDVAYSEYKMRPGMTTIVELPNGQYLLTYEYGGASGGFPVYYRIAVDPRAFAEAKEYPLVVGSTRPTSSPFVTWTPYSTASGGSKNGTILLSANSNSQIFSNGALGDESKWEVHSVDQPAAYTRTLRVLQNDPTRLLIMGAGHLPPSTTNVVSLSVVDLEKVLGGK
ncbi:hypothetical protein SEUCBS139899_004576 [Sporothrix eucalyptigena]